eukprot:CAMPEP_0180287192 /NCGR_PEP_ID=MMETSP0988-20121125/13171_1 /TAXON_ID=697907 /ORGANISM="non described non described, Strain CCMP2293" /LENGTH=96 /DNA_ID=CAMNT_0022261361 /DNA_START=376 /DNA_END=663 /DNA_ORIENTATION=-
MTPSGNIWEKGDLWSAGATQWSLKCRGSPGTIPPIESTFTPAAASLFSASRLPKKKSESLKVAPSHAVPTNVWNERMVANIFESALLLQGLGLLLR